MHTAAKRERAWDDARRGTHGTCQRAGNVHFLSETVQVYPTWEGLVAKYGIRGKHAHDARLVAMLIEHKVPRLLTFNDATLEEST